MAPRASRKDPFRKWNHKLSPDFEHARTSDCDENPCQLMLEDVDEPAPTNSIEPRGAGRALSHASQGGIGDARQGRVSPRRGDELFRQGRRLLHDLVRS